MREKFLTIVLSVLFCTLIGCRGEAERFDNTRIEPDPEMDLGADSIGDPHFVGQDGVREYNYNLERDLNVDRFIDPPENENPSYQFLIIDENNDGQLTREDFFLTTYFLANLNEEVEINQYEWAEAYEHMFYEHVDQDRFVSFDKDNNQELNLLEWTDALSDFDLFEVLDKDNSGLVSVEEWKRYLFDLWDYNNNGILTKEEAAIYSDYFNKR